MSKPIIGISGNILIDNCDKDFAGIHRAYVNNDYVRAIEKADGIPVILPLIFDEDSIKIQVQMVDGILITGGFDVCPQYYGEEPANELGFIMPELDEYDINLIKCAFELKKPIFGICRGMQILNVAFGGTLYQDLSLFEGSCIRHYQKSLRSAAGHTVDIIKGTKCNEILGDKIMTNSFHHQAVKEVASNMEVSALAKDGIIEAIEYSGDEFILGVQWHPESMFDLHPIMLKLFKKFVNVSK